MFRKYVKHFFINVTSHGVPKRTWRDKTTKESKFELNKRNTDFVICILRDTVWSLRLHIHQPRAVEEISGLLNKVRLHYALEQTRIITSTDYTVRFPKATGHNPAILRCNRLRINVTEKGLSGRPSQFSGPTLALLQRNSFRLHRMQSDAPVKNPPLDRTPPRRDAGISSTYRGGTVALMSSAVHRKRRELPFSERLFEYSITFAAAVVPLPLQDFYKFNKGHRYWWNPTLFLIIISRRK